MMSAAIHQMVLRKRAAQAHVEMFERQRDQIIAQAKGEPGSPGDGGQDGRGIDRVEIVNGDLIVTYTDKKKHNAGKVGGSTVYVGGGGSGFDMDSLPAGDAAIAPSEIAVKQAGAWARIGWSDFLAMVGATGSSLPEGTATVNGAAITVNGGYVTVTVT